MTTISFQGSADIAQIAMLLTQADEQDRAASRQIESTADEAATRDENERVNELESQASADEDAALSRGISDIVSGACTVGGALVSLAGPQAPSGAQASGAGDLGQSAVASSTARGLDLSAVLNGAGKGASGAGEILGGAFQGEAGRDAADAARSDAQAQADVRRYEQAHEDVQTENAAMQRVEQLLDTVQQTANAGRLTAATFRA